MNNNSVVVRIEKSGNRYNAWDADGTKWTHDITTGARKKAHANGMALERRINKSGNRYWWAVPMENFESVNTPPAPTNVEIPTDHAEVLNFIHNSYSLKPRGLMRHELKWKYLVRSGGRG